MTKNPTHLSSNRSKLKSSIAARRLILAALARTGGNQRAAARLLGLPNQAQLRKLLAGEIRDTPSMRAALLRADRRAARAWSLIRDTVPACIDHAALQTLAGQLRRDLAVLDHLLIGAQPVAASMSTDTPPPPV